MSAAALIEIPRLPPLSAGWLSDEGSLVSRRVVTGAVRIMDGAIVALVGLAIALAYVSEPIMTRDANYALLLAFSFGTYGLAKKRADVGAVESLAFETAVVSPLAVGYLVWLGATGAGTFTTEGVTHALLLASAGLVTAVPLICFSAAATRIPMVSLGLLQYLTPVLQFAVGVLVVGEDMPPGRWAGFALVWLALAVFTVESLRHRREVLATRRADVRDATV